MAVTEDVIQGAVARYDRERDRYIKLAARVADICRATIVDGHAIRAQITSRAKTIRSFEGKLRRFSRQPGKNFPTVDSVFDGVGDFAGVRIATYQPEDEPRVRDILKTLFVGPDGSDFEIDVKDKLNPAKGSFYRATHCQVFLREDELVGDYANLRGASCEIQICSMMAHVWNEIEHDIGYKPEGGGPGEAERGLLEVLGHLARSGDATITQLLAANNARMTAQTGDFADVHEFVARLRSVFPDADLSVNAGQAFDEATSLGLSSLEKIKAAIGPEGLDAKVAAQRIADFNKFLETAGSPELSLNAGSSDLLLVGLLFKYSDVLEKNHAGDRTKGRLGRIDRVVRKYREYLDTPNSNRDAA